MRDISLAKMDQEGSSGAAVPSIEADEISPKVVVADEESSTPIHAPSADGAETLTTTDQQDPAQESSANTDEPGVKPDQDHNDTSDKATETTKNENEEKEKMGKTILEAIRTLRANVDELQDNGSFELPSNVRHQLDELRKTGKKLLDGKDKSDDDEEYICEVLRLPMEDWLKKDWNKRDPPLHVMKAFYRSVPKREVEPSTESQVEDGDLKTAPVSEKPLRVMITSRILTRDLEEITGISIDYMPLIVARPWKLFVQYFPQMEQHLLRLKQDHKKMCENEEEEKQKKDSGDSKAEEDPERGGSGERKTPPPQSSVSKKQKDTPEKMMKRISHLELLINFIRSDLSHILSLRQKVIDGSLERISFEDLWHLFSPGDVVVSQERGHWQLSKAYMITGGLQRLRNQTRSEAEASAHMQGEERYLEMYRDSLRGTYDSDEDETRPRKDAAGKGTWSPLVVDCYQMGTDGTLFGRIDSSRQIRRFVGEKRITDLAIYPLRFRSDAARLKEQLVTRGRKFIQCSGHRSYNGVALDTRQPYTQERLQGDVYIDFEEYYRLQKKSRRPKLGQLRMSEPDQADITEQDNTWSLIDGGLNPGLVFFMDHEIDLLRNDKFISEDPLAGEPMKTQEVLESPEALALFSHRVVAYSFRTRRWLQLDVDNVKDIDKRETTRQMGWKELVIPRKYRELLLSLVESHAKESEENSAASAAVARAKGISEVKEEDSIRQIDLVRGKGLGLIILLHGPPGSGKTSTAETIAAFTGRPLYSLTCGDIGLNPMEVERNLEGHTRRADKWGCVLLIDEADVFLRQREGKDTERNALVSVFLRQLEYYAGILFLTTNRVGDLDEAFKSRIHISLLYPRLGEKETRKIWKNIMTRIERDNEDREIKLVFDREDLLEYAENQFKELTPTETTWNGRQIRNAFQTAIAMGHYDRKMRLADKGLTSEQALATGKKKWRNIKVTADSFETISSTAMEFENYMASMRNGENDRIKALMSEIRNDAYDGNGGFFYLPRQAGGGSRSGYSNMGLGPGYAGRRGHSPQPAVGTPTKSPRDAPRATGETSTSAAAAVAGSEAGPESKPKKTSRKSTTKESESEDDDDSSSSDSDAGLKKTQKRKGKKSKKKKAESSSSDSDSD